MIWRAKKIKLTNSDKFTLVDREDYPILSRYAWIIDCMGYCQTRSRKLNRIRMHELIMGTQPKRVQIYHLNGNPLDNRKANLIFATIDIIRHRKARCGQQSKYRGVWRDKARDLWASGMTVNKKTVKFGRFAKENDAALAYDAEAKKRFGKLAALNFPEKESLLDAIRRLLRR